MEKIKEIDVKQVFTKKKNRKSVEKYALIIKEFQKTDASKDRNFQKKFNGFFRVRRNFNWQKIYYTIMETGKTQQLSFENVLFFLYKQTGRVEASFTSKLIHTLNKDMPILDKYVLQNLDKKIPLCTGEEKIKNVVRIYTEIVEWYKNALQEDYIQEKIAKFDEVFPEYKWFSLTKKLDFLLWQIR